MPPSSCGRRPRQDPYPITTPPLKSRLPTHHDADDVLLPNPGISIKAAFRENFWCEFRIDEQLATRSCDTWSGQPGLKGNGDACLRHRVNCR
jgi:hypothetical protein